MERNASNTRRALTCGITINLSRDKYRSVIFVIMESRGRQRVRRLKRSRSWNVARKREHGERFLQMTGATNLADAASLLGDGSAPIHRRSLAARALGLSGDEAARQILSANDPGDDSPLGRACYRAIDDWFETRRARDRMRQKEEALASRRQLGDHSNLARQVGTAGTTAGRSRDPRRFKKQGWCPCADRGPG
jgi:hypothetical protein